MEGKKSGFDHILQKTIEESDDINFSMFLINLPETLGMTIEEIADELQVSRSTVKRWVIGKTKPHKALRGSLVEWANKKLKERKMKKDKSQCFGSGQKFVIPIMEGERVEVGQNINRCSGNGGYSVFTQMKEENLKKLVGKSFINTRTSKVHEIVELTDIAFLCKVDNKYELINPSWILSYLKNGLFLEMITDVDNPPIQLGEQFYFTDKEMIYKVIRIQEDEIEFESINGNFSIRYFGLLTHKVSRGQLFRLKKFEFEYNPVKDALSAYGKVKINKDFFKRITIDNSDEPNEPKVGDEVILKDSAINLLNGVTIIRKLKILKIADIEGTPYYVLDVLENSMHFSENKHLIHHRNTFLVGKKELEKFLVDEAKRIARKQFKGEEGE